MDELGDSSNYDYDGAGMPYADDESWKNKKMLWKLFTPVLIGSYAVAGLYIGRALTGSTGKLGMKTVGLVAGSSAVSAYTAPWVLDFFGVCPNSANAPLYEAAVSSAISYQILMFTSGTESAIRFIPVQLLAHVSGNYMSPEVKKWLKSMKSSDTETATEKIDNSPM